MDQQHEQRRYYSDEEVVEHFATAIGIFGGPEVVRWLTNYAKPEDFEADAEQGWIKASIDAMEDALEGAAKEYGFARY